MVRAFEWVGHLVGPRPEVARSRRGGFEWVGHLVGPRPKVARSRREGFETEVRGLRKFGRGGGSLATYRRFDSFVKLIHQFVS